MRPSGKQSWIMPPPFWKIMHAEASFRRINAADLLRDVYQGAKYANGVRIKEESVRDAP